MANVYFSTAVAIPSNTLTRASMPTSEGSRPDSATNVRNRSTNASPSASGRA